jgi:feruloyl esterase
MTPLIFPFLLLTFGIRIAASSCSAASIASLLPVYSGATVIDATKVPDGGNYGNGATDLSYPYNATNLPSLCAVLVNVATPGNTSYSFGLFLPQHYNDRLMTAGNGGLGGGISWVRPS